MGIRQGSYGPDGRWHDAVVAGMPIGAGGAPLVEAIDTQDVPGADLTDASRRARVSQAGASTGVPHVTRGLAMRGSIWR
ncbi:hypothetical protein [Cognatishimia sp. F0-27]|uniref:hypothetical protein n=1 Tax=Cognatishimia sp. F0-27 TaxID=2816855 RepID=UPI001D0C8B0E|nr:hypothetical protein [Cognatishimia sp. F0-27]MCC1491232.1 hypothetical protein [Cognatishimia sp. F0-27]